MFFVETLEETVINQRLRDIYGTHVACGKAHFRVAFSNDQLENRFVGEEITEHGIIIEVNAIKTVKKYPWLDNQWMVERCMPNRHVDVIEGQYIYECMWAFPENLPLRWEPVFHFVSSFMQGPISNTPKTQKECDYQEAEHMAKEKAFVLNMLTTTPLETSLNDGSAEFYSGAIDYRPSEQEKKENG